MTLRSLLLTLAILILVLGGLRLLVRAIEPRMAFFPWHGEHETPSSYGVAFEPRSIRTSDGETLRAWWIPHPDPLADVVYFHGNGGNLSIWVDILLSVQARRFNVLAVDYRGYGVSSGRPTEQGLYRDVEATLEHFHAQLKTTSRPVIYWGRSLGCAMAAYAATRRSPDALVLEAGFPDVRSLLRGSLVLGPLAWFASYRFATAAMLQDHEVPMLVMHGDRDSVIPFEQGKQLFDQLRTTKKRFHTIEGGDHNDAVPNHAEDYWRAVYELVNGLGTEGARSGG